MHSRFTVTGFVVTSLLFFYYHGLVGHPTSSEPSQTTSHTSSNQEAEVALEEQSWSPDNLYDVLNSTLGFERVFTVSLPERSDKRDAFGLQARLSNITYEYRDGVPGDAVSAKALPFTFDQDSGSTGCWRAHLNVMQEMVRDNIQTALIFEDDADWDIAFKHQMVQAARATRFLISQPEHGVPASPYGDGWDIIAVGHCSSIPDEKGEKYFVINDDPTVLPPYARREWEQPDMTPWEDGLDGDSSTRIYYKSGWQSCLAAYAISLRGAEKIIYSESMTPFNLPVDNGIGTMCKEGTLDITCIAPFPTLVGISKPAGIANRGSDIRNQDDVSVKDRAWSERVKFSIRQNIPRILTGAGKFIGIVPGTEDPVEELPFDSIARGVGHPEWLVNGQRYLDREDYLRERSRLNAQPRS